MEKTLIEKKVKLEKFDNGAVSQLIAFFSKILKQHEENLHNVTQEGLMSSQLRSIIIKSLLVILNFIYTKKYLKDIIAGFMKQPQKQTETSN